MARQNKAQMYRNLIILILVLAFIIMALIVFMNIKKKILG